MNNSDARFKSLFMNRFRVDDRVLQKGDPRTGRASVRSATEKETGNRVTIKQWGRNPAIPDFELKEIWRQELRQLHRLAGYPGARQYILPLLDSSEEEDGFVFVFDSGQRSPLQVVIDDANRNHWIKQPRLPQNKLTIWGNLLRVSNGLNLLHMQGLLHRNIDTWAIYTSGADTPDFQLSGFEWSIRLSSNVRNSPLQRSAIVGTKYVHSFLQDWHAFGALAATLFGIEPKKLLARRNVDSGDIAWFLSGMEKDLILLLLRSDPFSRIDGDTVNSMISAILTSLQTVITNRDERLYMVPKLGQGTDLSKSIREASGRNIEMADIAGQIDFIKKDLSENSQFVLSSAYAGAGKQQYLLFGRQLNYRLAPYRHIGGHGRNEPSWGIASCDSAAEKRPTTPDIVAYKTLSGNSIEVLSFVDLRQRYVTLQGKTKKWDQQLNLAEDNINSSDDQRQYWALLLVQILEALLIASEIWPVKIVLFKEDHDKNTLQLQYREDKEREKLAQELGLLPPVKRMLEAFREDKWQREEEWKLTDAGVLGEHDSEKSDWNFVEIKEVIGTGTIFIFEGSGARPLGDRLFLRHSSYVGTDKLLNRRADALLALRDHSELLDTLRDPRAEMRPTHEIITKDNQFSLLDESKQTALEEIWAVMPLFLLQGPPGVGKTRLVRELVRRRLIEDSSARILLSAQSHDAVDHLLHEIKKDLETLPDYPIVIRSKPRDDKREKTVFDLDEQARRLAKRISGSDLVKRLPLNIRSKIDALLPSLLNAKSDEDDRASKTLTRSLEALLLRSANLVFASANARDLELLIEERSQFDWTIIEEAGKAMGPELLAPLLLSHRRLMIGDHRQLPPFGADTLKKLLSSPENLSNALMIGESLVNWVFREAGLEEIVEKSKREDFPTVCSEAAEALMLFETLVTGNLKPLQKNGTLATARQLSFQHRMHPAIARLVSDAFYEGTLKTHPECRAKFAIESKPYIVTDNNRLPSSPIIFVDMPFVQSTLGRKEIEKTPRYYNIEEIDVVIEILSLLRANSSASKPSIAVLAPYREQVRRLNSRILEEKAGRLSHLGEFSIENVGGSPVSTVDSFQGNEADIVIISLVRNNAHSGLRGLGFLADRRRMNVLLSRARSKLIIIGSHEFLTSRFTSPLEEPGTQLGFLKKVLNSLEEQTKSMFSPGIPDVQIVSSAKIMGQTK